MDFSFGSAFAATAEGAHRIIADTHHGRGGEIRQAILYRHGRGVLKQLGVMLWSV